MSSGHTPGPWTFDATESQPGAFAIIGDGNQLVALVYGASRQEQRANAETLTAAPELLEALKAVVAIADRNTVEFDKARAAISKAELPHG